MRPLAVLPVSSWQETLGSDGMPMLYGVKIYTLLLDRLYQTSYHLGKKIESAIVQRVPGPGLTMHAWSHLSNTSKYHHHLVVCRVS